MTTSFADLGVPEPLITALSKKSITEPTPIQVAALPILAAQKETYLKAETGTGKTLAYLLPIFAKINCDLPHAQSIIVAPTYELAIQIHRQCTDLSQLSGMPVKSILLIGGTPKDRQLDKLKKKPHIIVGSIGRICDLIDDNRLKVHHVRTIVIDEADKILLSEALGGLRQIIRSTLKERSLIFVSATEESETKHVIESLAPSLVRIEARRESVNPNIEHFYLVCEERDKPEFVRKLIHAMKATRSIVFVHKNESAELLASKLAHHKLRVADLHGAQDKEDRKRAMDAIRKGSVDVLIASDVAARGLDIEGVSHVFNLDAPTESDGYLHRVGRTGRAGKSGIALSLLSGMQVRVVRRYEKELGIRMQRVVVREGQVFNFEAHSLSERET
jgi:superfamily II DNA/RNA helicase